MKYVLSFCLLVLVGTGCVQSPVSETARLELAGFTFDLSQNWSVVEIEGYTAYLLVPDAEYIVRIPFSIEAYPFSVVDGEEFLDVTAGGLQVYPESCAPGLGCYYLSTGDEAFLALFEEPISTEPVPENLDGVWYPSTDVTREELYDFLLTARLAE